MRVLGGLHLTVACFDGRERMATICGKMKKKVWILVGDILLIDLRDYEDAKCDVTHKYSVEEARQLKTLGQLPAHGKLIKLAQMHVRT